MDAELLMGLRGLFSDFNSGLFLGLASICYLLIQLLRGKFGFPIPLVTKYLERLSKETKTYLIHGLFILAGVLVTINMKGFNVWTVLDGSLAGLSLSFGANGARNTFKQGIDKIKQVAGKKPSNVPDGEE